MTRSDTGDTDSDTVTVIKGGQSVGLFILLLIHAENTVSDWVSYNFIQDLSYCTGPD